MPISSRLQSWLELRGIACSIDPEFTKLVPWMRTTVALCSSFMAIGTAFAYTPLLWAMVPIAALGAVFPRHPFDLVYNYGIRYLTGTGPLPLNGAPTRFACGLASVWLVGTILAFGSGAPWLGYLLGGVLASIVALVSVTHFCIPSLVYQLLFSDRALARSAVFGPRQEQSVEANLSR